LLLAVQVHIDMANAYTTQLLMRLDGNLLRALRCLRGNTGWSDKLGQPLSVFGLVVVKPLVWH